jgi:hypothetical protein
MDALQAAAYPVVRIFCLPIRYLLQINMLEPGKEMQFRGNRRASEFPRIYYDGNVTKIRPGEYSVWLYSVPRSLSSERTSSRILSGS